MVVWLAVGRQKNSAAELVGFFRATDPDKIAIHNLLHELATGFI